MAIAINGIGINASTVSCQLIWVLITTNTTHAANEHLYKKLSYDPVKDFAPITQMVRVPNVLVMNADTAARLKINTLADLIAYARKNPGKLNYGSGGNGTIPHLGGELLKHEAGIDLVHVPYKGSGPALMDMVAGNADVMFDNLPASLPHIQAGKLKPLAVAYSGGADSSALLRACAARWPGQVHAVHVHHGLQAAADSLFNLVR